MSETKENTQDPSLSGNGKRKEREQFPLWQRLFFSQVILGKSAPKKIAYIGVMTALCIVSNFLEIKLLDNQFSFTIFVSMLTGILVGPLYGCFPAFLGDTLGFLLHPGGLYMPWIGISVAMMALISGFLIKLPLNIYIKLALSCLLVLLVCSIGINTTGMFFYYAKIGFTTKTLGYIEPYFGGKNMYLTYALARLIFNGQLINSLVNYVLLFATVPLLKAIKPLKLDLN